MGRSFLPSAGRAQRYAPAYQSIAKTALDEFTCAATGRAVVSQRRPAPFSRWIEARRTTAANHELQLRKERVATNRHPNVCYQDAIKPGAFIIVVASRGSQRHP